MVAHLLSDKEILSTIKDGELKVSELDLGNIDLTDSNCPIQPSSLDLHVGKIFVPPKKKFDLTKLSKNNPKAVLGAKISPGHSAIIETKEEIELSEQVAAFGFPPARITQSALLMTNPGHIDPGFKGKLTFTVINLGRDDKQIDVGTIIVTLLVYKFERGSVSYSFPDRYDLSKFEPPNVLRARTLNSLSPDFGNFSDRLSKASLKAVEEHSVRLDWAKLWLPALTGAVTAAVLWLSSLLPSIDSIAGDKEVEARVLQAESNFDNQLSTVSEDLEEIRRDLKELQSNKSVLDFDNRLDELQRSVIEIIERENE